MAKETILIIDDEAIVQRSIAEILEGEGYSFLFAENGQTGLELFRAYKPILTLLDLRMPRMNGFDFLRNINLKPTDLASVIVLTAYGANEDISRCFELGVSNFIHKPFNIYELLGQVKQTIALKNAQRELVQEIEERRRIEAELSRHRDSLEDMVVTRSRELLNASAQLQINETRYKNLVDNLQLAFIVCVDLQITFANHAFYKLVKAKEPSEVIGHSIFQFVHPESHFLTKDFNLKLNQNGIQVEPINEKFITLNGEILDVDLTLTYTTYDSKPAIQLILQDVTRRIQLEEQLRQAQKLESIGLLAGGIAHDFGNILTGIIAYAEMLHSGFPEASSMRGFVDAIIKKADDASTLVRQILAFSRKQILDIKVVNLNTVLHQSVGFLAKVMRDNVKIATSMEQDLSSIDADVTAVQQILTNLCVNAQAAMPNGGEIYISTTTVTLNSRFCDSRDIEPGDYVLLTVSDTGTGMTKEVRERIFEPFFTTKSAGEGTGLGLSMVHGLVKQHHGYIECHSSIGDGTEFHIYFPVSQSNNCDDMIPEMYVPTTGTETILLVEDDLDMLIIIRSVLENSGYTVYTAKTGLEAYEFISERDPDAPLEMVVSDIFMKEMTGIELREKLPDLNFLLISGYDNDAYAKFKLTDNTGFLQKPFTANQLNKKVRQLLDKAKSPY